jgi:hypothetical protein
LGRHERLAREMFREIKVLTLLTIEGAASHQFLFDSAVAAGIKRSGDTGVTRPTPTYAP